MKIKNVKLATAKEYHLIYRNAVGQIKSYCVSNPISESGSYFVSYCHGHGPRTFIKNRVIKIKAMN